MKGRYCIIHCLKNVDIFAVTLLWHHGKENMLIVFFNIFFLQMIQAIQVLRFHLLELEKVNVIIFFYYVFK